MEEVADEIKQMQNYYLGNPAVKNIHQMQKIIWYNLIIPNKIIQFS